MNAIIAGTLGLVLNGRIKSYLALHLILTSTDSARNPGSDLPSLLLFPFFLAFELQNLSFGPAKTNSIAKIHSPAIHAYSIIRPHHPFPSLILFNKLIRLPAASMPVVFFSSPSVARLSVSVSVASEAENWVDEALRA